MLIMYCTAETEQELKIVREACERGNLCFSYFKQTNTFLNDALEGEFSHSDSAHCPCLIVHDSAASNNEKKKNNNDHFCYFPYTHIHT